MRLLSLPLLSLAGCLLPSVAEATSRPRNPLSSISTVRNATIHTHTRRVTAWSEFELTFVTGDDLHVKFRLEPNHDILPAASTVTYLGADGAVDRLEEVDRAQHKVFKGTAWIRKPNIGQDIWQNAGWARVMVHVDGMHPMFEGSFAVHHDFNHIQSSANYQRTRHGLDPVVQPTDDTGAEYMILWRDSDILSNTQMLGHHELRRALDVEPASCQSDRLSFNSNPNHPVFVNMRKRSDSSPVGAMDLASLFAKRQSDTTTNGNSAGVNLTSTIGQANGCPSPRKVALVGIAADCNYVATFNSTDSAKSNILSQMNVASAIWEGAFNISLGVANWTVVNATCPSSPPDDQPWNQACSSPLDIQDRLNLFSAWRGQQAGNYSHWTLLSTCNTGSTIGLAWLGQACVSTAMTVNSSTTGDGTTSGTQAETVAGANVVISSEGTTEWQIIAHETGHTFGAVHDCDTSTCANANIVNSQQCCPLSAGTCDAGEKYIMNPYAVEGAKTFSACTVGNICSAIGRNSVNTACLADNRQVNTITGQQCGNGIVEEGEECDCGGTAGCGDDKCCDPNTCKFTTGSVCDDANESCCQNCQLATNGTVCRASTGLCDPQEVCSGSSPNCPADQTKPDGTSCGSGLQCASGECTSRDQQCKTVMGSYTQGNDTYACSSSGCVISCASPEFGTGVCYGLQQNFLDGTECGNGGTCQNGQCKGSSADKVFKHWIQDHKGIVIGVCTAIGVLLLLVAIACIWSVCTRRRTASRQAKGPTPPAGGWQGWQGWQPASSQPDMTQQRSDYYFNTPPWYHGSNNAANNNNNGGGSSNNSTGALAVPAIPRPTYNSRMPSGQSVRYA